MCTLYMPGVYCPFSNDVAVCKEPQCEEPQCGPHMYTCDSKCYNYNNGHVMYIELHPNVPTAPPLRGPENEVSCLDDITYTDPLKGMYNV